MTLIAIDGPAGAGKTTLAAKLERDFAANKSVTVIHMDDLYAGWLNALDANLTARLDGIVQAHNAQRDITIDIFNWASMSFDSTRTIHASELLIIEGVGAGQRIVRQGGAKLYWLDIEPSVGLARVLARDGVEIQSQMKQWQIDQDLHFSRDLTRNYADHILTS